MKPAAAGSSRYYFDWAATGIPDFSIAKTVLQSEFPFANPSSMHSEGRAAKDALENARVRCAAALGVPPGTVYFTSGGTESNCIAVYSMLARQGKGRTLASEAEHSSISENVKNIERLGKPAGFIPVDSNGRVTPELLSETLKKYSDARFAAVMAVNNETGTVNDIAELVSVIRKNTEAAVHFHCDAVQAAGKIPVNLLAWGVDSASVSAHKIGGPRGIGILYLKKPLEALYLGGGQEKRIRAGTENVAGAVALAACLEKQAEPEALAGNYKKAFSRCKRLLEGLKKIERCSIIPNSRSPDSNGCSPGFSPYIVQAAFAGIPGEVMARTLDDMGFAVSTGAACSSATPQRPVLAAMGISGNALLEGIRISQGWTTEEADIDSLIAAINEVLKLL